MSVARGCRLGALALAAAGLGAPDAAAPQAGWTALPMAYDSVAVARPVPVYAQATDPIAALMAVPPLRSVRLPAGDSELRVWVGFGIVIPDVLLRITATPETTRGELVNWWSALEPAEADPRFDAFMAEQRQRAGRYGCNAAQTGTEWRHGREGRVRRGWSYACRVDLAAEEPDWAGLLARLDDLGIRGLPAPDSLEPGAVQGTDGISIEVEVLKGARYRTYTYWSPRLQPWPEAERVNEILELVLVLGHHAGGP